MNCPKCQTPNAPTAQYCTQCGQALAATSTGTRTVVQASGPQSPQQGPVASVPPPAPPAMSPQQATGLAARAANSFGSAAMPLMSMNGDSRQRELTFFVDDGSGSMSGDCQSGMNKLEATIRAVATMVVTKNQVDPVDEVGLIVFNEQAQLLLPLSPIQSCKSQFLQTLQSLVPDDGTDINEGLKCAQDHFDWTRNDVVRRVILLTDGYGGDPTRTARDLKSQGVIIDVIGVGDSPLNVDEKLLKTIASTVQGELRYRFIRDQQTLLDHYTALAGKTATA